MLKCRMITITAACSSRLIFLPKNPTTGIGVGKYAIATSAATALTLRGALKGKICLTWVNYPEPFSNNAYSIATADDIGLELSVEPLAAYRNNKGATATPRSSLAVVCTECNGTAVKSSGSCKFIVFQRR